MEVGSFYSVSLLYLFTSGELDSPVQQDWKFIFSEKFSKNSFISSCLASWDQQWDIVCYQTDSTVISSCVYFTRQKIFHKKHGKYLIRKYKKYFTKSRKYFIRKIWPPCRQWGSVIVTWPELSGNALRLQSERPGGPLKCWGRLRAVPTQCNQIYFFAERERE